MSSELASYKMDLKYCLMFRHKMTVPFYGGFVCPRDEARRVIKIIRCILNESKHDCYE